MTIAPRPAVRAPVVVDLKGIARFGRLALVGEFSASRGA
jgi:hypothetical protein